MVLGQLGGVGLAYKQAKSWEGAGRRGTRLGRPQRGSPTQSPELVSQSAFVCAVPGTWSPSVPDSGTHSCTSPQAEAWEPEPPTLHPAPVGRLLTSSHPTLPRRLSTIPPTLESQGVYLLLCPLPLLTSCMVTSLTVIATAKSTCRKAHQT